MVRYVDDAVLVFSNEADAREVKDLLAKRFSQYGLSLHPDKTRLIEFGRHAAARRAQRGLGKPETFTFLGFTFVCGKSRRGRFLIKRKTRRDRMRAKLGEIKKEMRRRLHQPIPEQGKWLRQVVSGFFAYHAVHQLEVASCVFVVDDEGLGCDLAVIRCRGISFSAVAGARPTGCSDTPVIVVSARIGNRNHLVGLHGNPLGGIDKGRELFSTVGDLPFFHHVPV